MPTQPLPPNDPADDVKKLEMFVHAYPQDVKLHQQLADAHHRLLQRPDRVAQLTAIVAELPYAFTSMLHLAAIHAAAKQGWLAATGFTRAIKTAQLAGFWHDESSTPPWLLQVVMRGMDIGHEGRVAIFQERAESWATKYGKDEMARVTKALSMYLGLEPTVYADPRQRPSFLYIPDLPVTPVFPRALLPFAEAYEARTESIKTDLRAVQNAGDGAGIQPFHYDVPEAKRDELTAGGAWDAYFFYDEGVAFTAHHAACPNVMAALGELPLDHVRDHGPEVCFSIMRPGAHILPHRGVTNARGVMHLGLEIPPDCALSLVGIQDVTWEAGRCFAFDDTYEHEAWNRSDRVRVILLADIWNPHLRPAEREALADLIPFIGDFNRQSAPAVTTTPDPEHAHAH